MEERLIGIKNAAISFILEAESLKELEVIKLQFLGRSGQLTQAMKELPKLSKDQRVEVGKLANEVKTTIEEAIENAQATLSEKSSREKKQQIDTTAPGISPAIGHLHPMTQTLYDIVEIFKEMGFQAADGPEIEK